MRRGLRDSASSGPSGGTASSSEPQATVVGCADKGKDAEKGKGKSGRPAATVTSGRADVRVPAGKSRTVRVPLDDPSVVGTVVRCEVVSVL
ncbi:hypothetical protein JBE27_17275 [Streptomyces albiflaviniger]|nr:hypothetical protein [Streptomyces albiflaviniger]